MTIANKLSKKKLLLIMVVAIVLGYYGINYLIKWRVEQARLSYLEKGHHFIELVKYGSLEQIKAAVAAGADVNFGEYDNRYTAIVSATLRGDLAIVKYLVEQGADIHRDFDSDYLTGYAVAQPNKEVLIYLLEQGIDPNKRRRASSMYALNMAIYNNNFDYVKILIEHGHKGATSYYAIFFSVMLPDSQITEYLLEHGANYNLTLEEGSNLLIAAASAGSLANVKLLIEKGIAVDKTDDYDLTPLIIAAAKGYTEIVAYLINQGANVNQQTLYGNTALIAAANQGDLASVKLLLKAGAEVAIENKEGLTALAFALDGKQSAIKELLLKQGASLATAQKALAKQQAYVEQTYPKKPLGDNNPPTYPAEWKRFDPSMCNNPKDEFVYLAYNRLVVKVKVTSYFDMGYFNPRDVPEPLPKPLDSKAPAGCYENPKQDSSSNYSDYEPNFFYGTSSDAASTIRLNREEKIKECNYLPFSTLRCPVMKGNSYAYRVDGAIYSSPLNQPFVIFCIKPGFSFSGCKVIYKKGKELIRYPVNPDNKNYGWTTEAESIKEIINYDKGYQQRIEQNTLTNYPWQN